MNDAKHHRDDQSADECDSARRGHQTPEVQLEAVPWGDSRRERAHPLAQRLRRYRAAGPKFLNELKLRHRCPPPSRASAAHGSTASSRRSS